MLFFPKKSYFTYNSNRASSKMQMFQIKETPVANGVAKEDTPAAGVEPNNGAVLVKEGVEVDKEPKSEVWGEAADPNKEDTGADVTGVEKREDDGVEAAGVLKSVDPLPDGAEEKPAAVWGAADVPAAAVLANKPATWVDGCGFAGKCCVGWTLRAAASCLAVSLLSASRKGSFIWPRRRWSARYAVFMDSMYWCMLSTYMTYLI